jgi:hypothetical protein
MRDRSSFTDASNNSGSVQRQSARITVSAVVASIPSTSSAAMMVEHSAGSSCRRSAITITQAFPRSREYSTQRSGRSTTHTTCDACASEWGVPARPIVRLTERGQAVRRQSAGPERTHRRTAIARAAAVADDP